MIWWLIDNAKLVYVALAVVALVLAAIYWRNRRGKHLIALGAIVALVGLFWLLTRLIITDRKQIQQNLFALANTVLEQRPFGDYLTPEFEFQGLKRDAILAAVPRTVRDHEVTNFHIWEFSIDELSRPEKRAKASFYLRVDSAHGEYPMLCRGTFTLDNEKWRLQNMEIYHYNPLGSSGSPLSVPLSR